MTKNTYLIIGVVLVLVVAGFVLVGQRGGNEALAPTGQEVTREATPTPTPTTNEAPAIKTVIYTNDGAKDVFSPANLTIKAGDTVIFKVENDIEVWPASGPHPTHTNYPEFDPKREIAPGETWSFTFTKKGTWKYHNHLNPTEQGTITVQ